MNGKTGTVFHSNHTIVVAPSYSRLETFYPVEEVNEVYELKNSYFLEKVNEELSVYVKK